MSSGEKQMLAILLTVLVQDNQPYVFFMDEPEVSLHVDWQQQLIDLVLELNPNVQIILTTHSPAVIMNGWMDKVTEVTDITLWRMANRLHENLSSRYVEAANKLRPKASRRKIIAYVESYDDIFFWRTVLSSLETPQVAFQVMLPSRSKRLERGKKAVLMNLLGNRVGDEMIACVDADYD